MTVCYRCVCSYNGGTEGSCEIVQSKHPFQGDLQADKVSSQTALGPVEVSNKTKGIMETQHNPNEPGKPDGPGKQGGQEGDRERQERERQQREREKQGGGGGGQPGGGQQGGR